MPIVGQKSKSVYVWSGDDWYTYTKTINFGPATAHAQACVTAVSGEGAIATGIVAYSHRPDPDGPDVDVPLSSDWWNAPNIVGAFERMTGITWMVTMASDNSARARVDILFWG